MDANYYYTDECPVRFALSILHGKWRMRVIWELSKEEKVRFNELQRQTEGISAIALSKELKALEDLKLVNRKQYGTIPPKVEYSLTDLGKNLHTALIDLGDWGIEVKNKLN